MEVGIEQAKAHLAAGRPLVFPTDTVWGFGVAVAHAEGPGALARAKGRADGKPIAWLVAAPDALDAYGVQVPAYARALADAFWPGALTLVVAAAPDVPAAYLTHGSTIGLRMPASETVLELVRATASPLAATSANFAGRPAPPADARPDAAFLAAAGAPVLDAGRRRSAPRRADAALLASAVVDCTGSAPRLLRAGTISASDMQRACGVALA